MAKYRECPFCGCSLDFGEKCDCKELEKRDAAAAVAAAERVRAALKEQKGRTHEGR